MSMEWRLFMNIIIKPVGGLSDSYVPPCRILIEIWYDGVAILRWTDFLPDADAKDLPVLKLRGIDTLH